MIKNLILYFTYILISACSLSAMETFSSKDVNGIPFDHKLVELLNMKNGIFIEVGANNGIIQSNTLLLEKYFDWTGILIEPSPILYESLCNNRPNSHCYQCALGSFSENNTFIFGDFDSNLMSSINGKRLHRKANTCVIMKSLQSILDKEGLQHINLFSLDTEGYEYNILQGIDFDKVTFDYLLIEIYARDYDLICSFLDNKGYKMTECFSQYNHQQLPNWGGNHNDYLFKRKGL